MKKGMSKNIYENDSKKNSGDVVKEASLKKEKDTNFLNNILCIDAECKGSLAIEPKKNEYHTPIPHNMSELNQYTGVLIPEDTIYVDISHTNPRRINFRYMQSVKELPIIPNYKEILESLPDAVSIMIRYEMDIYLKPSNFEVAGVDNRIGVKDMDKKELQSIIDTIIPDSAENISVKHVLPKYRKVRFTVREDRNLPNIILY